MTGFMGPVDSPAGRRAWLAGLCEDIPKTESKNDLLDMIDSALSVSEPEGSPATLESLSKRYRDQVDNAGGVHDRVQRVAGKGLPDIWVGDTSVLASDAVFAAGRAVLQMAEAFQGGANALLRLADALGEAQRQDAEGRGRMGQAKSTLGGRDGFFDNLHEDDEEEWDRLTARAPGGGRATGASTARRGHASSLRTSTPCMRPAPLGPYLSFDSGQRARPPPGRRPSAPRPPPCSPPAP
ncbi:hypothetical protein SGLAM104S_06736 [Streptomyces glaucescens]